MNGSIMVHIIYRIFFKYGLILKTRKLIEDLCKQNLNDYGLDENFKLKQ